MQGPQGEQVLYARTNTHTHAHATLTPPQKAVFFPRIVRIINTCFLCGARTLAQPPRRADSGQSEGVTSSFSHWGSPEGQRVMVVAAIMMMTRFDCVGRAVNKNGAGQSFPFRTSVLGVRTYRVCVRSAVRTY